MNKAYIKCYLQRKVPSVRFETQDFDGDNHPETHIHCVVPEKDLYALERAAEAVGKKAVWPLCPNIGGQHRVVEVTHEECL